jgi:hypothetical protein
MVIIVMVVIVFVLEVAVVVMVVIMFILVMVVIVVFVIVLVLVRVVVAVVVCRYAENLSCVNHLLIHNAICPDNRLNTCIVLARNFAQCVSWLDDVFNHPPISSPIGTEFHGNKV